MSRATSAAGAVTTAPSNNLHLVVGHGPRGPVLTVSKIPVPGCITMACQDYHEFLFYMLQIFRVMNQGSIQTKDENTKNTPYEKIAQNADVFKEIAFCLYAHIATRVAPGLSEHDQLERTALALYSSNVTIPPAYYATQKPIFYPATWNTPGRHFFDMSVAQRIAASTSHQTLLNSCLNAVEDLNEINCIIENTRPEELPILLSAKGTATITHLKDLGTPIERTGTALQMAIYGDDEGVQVLLKEYMNRAEYERQAIEAFSSVLPLEIKQRLAEERASAAKYQEAMVAQQQEDAKNLCAELEAAIRKAVPSEFICAAPNNIASTTSASVTAAVDKFKNDLLHYTQKNPVHNRYILERLYEINAALQPWSVERDCYLSQQGIGEAQLLMSARWVQHYAVGPLYIAENEKELAGRVFTCRDSDPIADIRGIMSHLRSDGHFLSIFGGDPRCNQGGQWLEDARLLLQILCRAKTASFQNLLRRECPQA